MNLETVLDELDLWAVVDGLSASVCLELVFHLTNPCVSLRFRDPAPPAVPVFGDANTMLQACVGAGLVRPVDFSFRYTLFAEDWDDVHALTEKFVDTIVATAPNPALVTEEHRAQLSQNLSMQLKGAAVVLLSAYGSLLSWFDPLFRRALDDERLVDYLGPQKASLVRDAFAYLTAICVGDVEGDPVDTIPMGGFGVLSLNTATHSIYATVTRSEPDHVALCIVNGGDGYDTDDSDDDGDDDGDDGHDRHEISEEGFRHVYSFCLTDDEYREYVETTRNDVLVDAIYIRGDDPAYRPGELVSPVPGGSFSPDVMNQRVGNCSVFNLHNALRIGSQATCLEWAQVGALIEMVAAAALLDLRGTWSPQTTNLLVQTLVGQRRGVVGGIAQLQDQAAEFPEAEVDDAE